MPSFTYPGVYIEELSSGQHTIAGVATSIGAFIGWAAQGPVDSATLVQSWGDFQTYFGGLDSRSWLGYAVNQFFANGGDQCYVIRLVWDGTIPGGNNSPVACATAIANGVGYGTAEFQATLNGVMGTLSLGVGTPLLESIAVLPAGVTTPTHGAALSLPPLPLNATMTLTAVGTNSDASTSTPSNVTWISSSPSTASVSPAGVVTALAASTTPVTITASSGAVSGSISLTVTNASLTAITVTPAAVTTDKGQTVQLAAAAVYSDGTSPDITSIAIFSSNTPADVTFTSTAALPLNPGELQALVAGAPTVKATLPSAWSLTPTENTATITINAAAITGITMSPANATVPLHTEGSETEPASFSVATSATDNSSQTLNSGSLPAGASLEFSSSNTGVATVDGSGNLTLVGAGTTTVTATYMLNGVTYTTTTLLTVTNAHLTGIVVTPSTATLAGGQSQQFTVTGVFDDNTTVDCTGFATWQAAAPASVSGPGLITVGKGVTTASQENVTATWLGLNATATLKIEPPVVMSLAITATPSVTALTPGQNVSLAVNATMSDGTTQTGITSGVTWKSLTPTLATVSSSGVASATAAGGALTLFAANPGAWGNSLRVTVTALPAPNAGRFNVLVQQVSKTGQLVTLESYISLSVQSTDQNYAVTVINNDSNYITFMDPLTGQNVVPTGPPNSTTGAVAFSGGADGTVLKPNDGNFELAMTQSTTAGYQLLERVEIFNLLCVPGETDSATISTLQAYCAKKRSFYIVDSPADIQVSALIQSGPVGTTGSTFTGGITGEYSTNSAYYFPWVLAPDPLTGNRPALFPPSGFVAGIYAATDAGRGVWKAPAGINASLTGNSGLQYVLTDEENGSLNPQAVNCLRQFKVYGDVVWGGRTLAGNDQAGSQWKYVPIRRLALYIESSLFDGTQWVVFEPNDETLWGQVRMNVGTFMQGLFLQGAFAGTTPQQAYFVKCDSDNNPPGSVALGVVNVLVGFAPLYPAEFVVIQIQQIVAQGS